MRRLAFLAVVAGTLLVPATPAFAHGGDAPDATAYRIRVVGVSTPERGLTVRTVEAGSRLELSNRTGHSVEVLGYSGEPYLDVRPDGTYQNDNSPAAYLNATLAGETPVPPGADPTAPPAWRRISTATTVRWHDHRTPWLGPGLPPAAAADPTRAHRLRDWTVPLRVQVRTFEIRGTLDWEPPPRTWLWWSGAGACLLTVAAIARRWPRSVAPLALLAGLAPLWYATSRTLDGGTVAPVLLFTGLLGWAAAYRHPPFFLALSGAAVAIFGGFGSASALRAAVLPTAGPDWLARMSVLTAVGVGAGLALTGVLGLRADLRSRPPGPRSSSAGLSSSA